MRPLSQGAGIEWCRFGRPRRSFSGRVFQPRRGRHRFGRFLLGRHTDHIKKKKNKKKKKFLLGRHTDHIKNQEV